MALTPFFGSAEQYPQQASFSGQGISHPPGPIARVACGVFKGIESITDLQLRCTSTPTLSETLVSVHILTHNACTEYKDDFDRVSGHFFTFPGLPTVHIL